jgi:formylglycine-generating enzyme required for sulfatase activity
VGALLDTDEAMALAGPPHGPKPVGAACTTDADCQSGGCSTAGVCASAPSCTAHEGGATCGPSGGDDCCRTLPVPRPGAPYRLDKYNVTAGRFRVFIQKTRGNVRGWVRAHRPDWFEPSWLAFLPRVMDDGTAVRGDSHLFAPGEGIDGVYQQLGPIHYGLAEGGGNEGCLTKEIGNARTYRLPDAVNTRLFADVQQYSEEVLDQKSLQCATFFMLAAFCAWDGGRIPTIDELDYAWDAGDPATRTYPWGNAPEPGGWNDAYPFDPTGQGFGLHAPSGGDLTYANYRYNVFLPPHIRCVAGTDQCDYSLYIAPPGRFPHGDGPFGHSDLAGNVYDYALPMDGTPDTPLIQRQVRISLSGAFDNHGIPAKRVDGGRPFHATNKYLAVGARCAR